MMEKRKLLKVLVAGLLVLALLVPMASCGEEEGPVREGQYGGVLDYYTLSYPGGFDMHRKISYCPWTTIPVFNNLVRMDPRKSTVEVANLAPDLAESWEVSDDGLTWTFHLYEGVKWHDGTPFTADDVVYSMEKMMDKERSSVSGYFDTLDQVIKVDDHTVKMVHSKASPPFLLALAVGYCSIQAKHMANVDYKSTDFLVGTGPFKFKSATPGVSIELEKNPNYHKEGLPYLDGIKIHTIKDRAAQANALLSGRLDMMCPGLGITNKDQYEQMMASKPEGVEMAQRNPPTGAAMWFNFNFEPFQDVRVRRAIMLMNDREQSALAGYGSLEFANLSATLLKPPYAMGKDAFYELAGMNKSYEERIAEAKQLLVDAGYADGFTIRYPMLKMAEARGALWLQDMFLKHLNVKMELTQVDFAELYKMRDAGEWDLFSSDLRLYVPDPNGAMAYFLCDSPANFANICDPELDRMWEEQSTEMDFDKRLEMCRAIERKIVEEALCMPGSANRRYHVQWNWVKGFVQQTEYYQSEPSFEHTWLDKSLMPE